MQQQQSTTTEQPTTRIALDPESEDAHTYPLIHSGSSAVVAAGVASIGAGVPGTGVGAVQIVCPLS
mgnify:CR=1 FL=1